MVCLWCSLLFYCWLLLLPFLLLFTFGSMYVYSKWLSPLLLCNRFVSIYHAIFFPFFVFFRELVSISLFIEMHKNNGKRIQQQNKQKGNLRKIFHAKHNSECLCFYFGGQMKWHSIFLCHFFLTSITGSCHNSPSQILCWCKHKKVPCEHVEQLYFFRSKICEHPYFHIAKHISIV